MDKKLIISSLLAIAASGISAQEITAVHQTVDCGGVRFNQPVTVNFELKNKMRNAPRLKIDDTTLDLGKLKGKKKKSGIITLENFVISATYDARQMGHFCKQLAVYSNASSKPYYLTLKGVVAEGDISFSGGYPVMLGDIKADVNHVEFDDVNRGEMPLKRIHVMNSSNKAVNPVVMHLPEYLRANVSPTTIPAGKQGVVELTLNSNNVHDYGLTQTSEVSLGKEIEVSVVLLPSFKEMTEDEMRNAPRLNIDNTTLDLGKLKGKKKKSGTITLENVGKSELDITSLQMFTAGLSVQLSKSRLQVGDKATLKITADPKAMKNLRSEPRVLMITNDPKNAKVVINVKVER